MSVIVKCPDGKIRMYCKGADSVVKNKISLNVEKLEFANKALLKFARKGLRTLMIAYKEITEIEYQEWSNEYSVNISLLYLDNIKF